MGRITTPDNTIILGKLIKLSISLFEVGRASWEERVWERMDEQTLMKFSHGDNSEIGVLKLRNPETQILKCVQRKLDIAGTATEMHLSLF